MSLRDGDSRENLPSCAVPAGGGGLGGVGIGRAGGETDGGRESWVGLGDRADGGGDGDNDDGVGGRGSRAVGDGGAAADDGLGHGAVDSAGDDGAVVGWRRGRGVGWSGDRAGVLGARAIGHVGTAAGDGNLLDRGDGHSGRGAGGESSEGDEETHLDYLKGGFGGLRRRGSVGSVDRGKSESVVVGIAESGVQRTDDRSQGMVGRREAGDADAEQKSDAGWVGRSLMYKAGCGREKLGGPIRFPRLEVRPGSAHSHAHASPPPSHAPSPRSPCPPAGRPELQEPLGDHHAERRLP